ncbi:hypothetical protein SAMN05877809_10748 [Rhodobacter sp. JA431]|uniref:SH3 domain-containing protein n=1 Tax=Rhodobacter sp. JA431 TaxID=570013 RepID=UPI000BC51BD1|nr:SH3 domain-containing protein [Rhodobacter sp. JA431]SOC13976.1 hypothetical protein SAMN05877809_10748 [Rhodobacter sp. JA431]
MERFVGAALALSLWASAAAAGPLHVCSLNAWTTDPDPAGLNVRTGPGTQYPIIAVLPPVQRYGRQMTLGTEVSITGAKDGWMRIEAAWFDDYGMGGDDHAPVQQLFSGEGWVSGRLVSLLLNRDRLFAEPSRAAPVVALFDEIGMGPDAVEVTRLRDCLGDFVKIEGNYAGQKVAGWADWTCANQVTTCP